MNIKGKQYRTIALHPENDACVQIIDQRMLPHEFILRDIYSVEQMAVAIQEMWLRGAPLIGAAAAYGIYLSACENYDANKAEEHFNKAYQTLLKTRPTAVNLKYALDKMMKIVLRNKSKEETILKAKISAADYCDHDVEVNKQIGEYGLELIENIYEKKKQNPLILDKTVYLLTHCNAGWLATVDYGTATAAMYLAHEKKIPLHVFVSETRPRNQGAALTAWELLQENIPHTLIVDNAAGHLLQNKKIDLVIVGTDRTSVNGDVCNKIGTYLKALAAFDQGIPFYVAAPSSSIDLTMEDAFSEIDIEVRNSSEVKFVQGISDNTLNTVLICPEETAALNYAFDITPARLVSGLITEKGICKATKEDILKLLM